MEENDYEFSGAISGAGNLSKSNSGNLTLTQSPSWIGSTTVLDGTLILEEPGLHDDSDFHLDLNGSIMLNFNSIDTVANLVIDGNQQAAGTWGEIGSGAQHQSSRISGPGMLYVPSAFEKWIADYYPEGPERDFNADPDRDGIPNGIEFVVGAIPRADLETAAQSLSKLPTFSRSGNSIIFSFRRTDASAYLNPFVQHGPDLETWTPATAGDPGVSIVENPIAMETGISLITVTVPLPVMTAGGPPPSSYFARLAVSP